MSVAVPRIVRQVVLFSSGPWGERICVNAELNNADRMPITIGKLTPYNKSVHTHILISVYAVFKFLGAPLPVHPATVNPIINT